jgi:ATP-dependent exoDNAse (exonuclease V) beta subunit
VFLDLDDISRNNKWHDIARLMYVGLTRATDKVYLYGNLRNLPSQQREPE